MHLMKMATMKCGANILSKDVDFIVYCIIFFVSVFMYRMSVWATLRELNTLDWTVNNRLDKIPRAWRREC